MGELVHHRWNPRQFLARAQDTEKVALTMAGVALMMSLAIATKLLCFRSVSARELREPLAPVTVNAQQVVATAKVKTSSEIVVAPQPEVPPQEPRFEFKPSVGTWLCHTRF